MFFLLQTQSCIIINRSFDNSNDEINIDSLIGIFHSTNKEAYSSGGPSQVRITFRNDTSFFIAFVPKYAGPILGELGKWRIKGKYILMENYPMRKPILLDSKKTNDKFITIQTIGDAPFCFAFSDGNLTSFFEDDGFFKIPKNGLDSIRVTDNIVNSYMIYNKEIENNNFTINFFEIKSLSVFSYKLKIGENYSLKGQINNYDYIFFKQ